MKTGLIIQQLRKRKNMTQEELGAHLGVTKASIQKYENGSIVNLKVETIKKMCELFQVPPFQFIYPEATEEQIVEWYANTPEHVENYEKILKNRYGEMALQVLKASYKLNDKGNEKMLEYVNDLLLIKKYKK